jgi:SNF2 family DNA or RNA helicase
MSQPSEASKTSYHTLSEKQVTAIDFINSGDTTLLIAPTGEGKTSIALHAIRHAILAGHTPQAIVACPASVVSHWPNEPSKWQELQGLYVGAVVGTPKERREVVETLPDVLVVSLNNLSWLLDQKPVLAKMVVIDELSKAAGKFTAKLRHKKHQHIDIRIGMTATPVSESFENLFGMVRVIDSGKTFGRSKERFMDQYFIALDYKGYKHELRAGADKELMAAIAPMLHNVTSTKAETLPPKTVTTWPFDMPHDTRLVYEELKKSMLSGTHNIVAATAATLSNKLRQVASGFAIDDDDNVVDFDYERAYQAHQWVRDLFDKKGIILYQFNHQRAQLEYILSDYDTTSVYGGCDKAKALADFHGDAQILIAQESTLSHGVDGLQHICRDMLFYQPTWSRDINEQAPDRLWRTGQEEEVRICTLVCNHSIDQAVLDRLDHKGQFMDLFLAHLKETN